MAISLVSVVLLGATLAGADTQELVSPIFDGHAALTPRNKIDELVFARLKQLNIEPARICTDGVFVRRVYLDVIGTLPTAEEACDFLQDTDHDKREKLIDRLLQRDEFADYWAMKWSDLLRVKAEFPINLWPNAAQAYYRWIRTGIRDNVPYDRFVREMLTANGSNFRVGQVNFYRAVQSKTPQGISQAVALTFLGSRAQNWPKDRMEGMAAFFSQINFKATREWKEEIVTYDPAKAGTAAVKPIFPDGTPARLSPNQDPRTVFADWLITPQNPWFARNIVNRAWSWFLGRGIIHEPDDIRPDNPPSNPQLLAYLEQELVAGKYDMKHLFRVILNSQTYQLSSVSRCDRPEAVANFARYPVRRLEAEVLIDALNQITGTSEQYASPIPEPFTFVPEEHRSIALPDGSITSPFLEQFGRSSRDTGLESERSNRPTADQRLHLLNSSHIQRKIESSPKLLALIQSSAIKGSGKSENPRKDGKPHGPGSGGADVPRQPGEVLNNLYLTILSRYPTPDEMKTVGEYVRSASSKREAVIDVVWALINSSEFLCRH